MIRVDGCTLKEKRLMKRVEKLTLKCLSQPDFFVTDFAIVDGETIRQFNLKERGVDRVTDVLSFPSFDALKPPVKKEDFKQADFEGKRVVLGSVLICRSKAEEQAREFGHGVTRELGFLTCHALLHLFGFDHVKEEDEKVMLEAQRKIMAMAGLKR